MTFGLTTFKKISFRISSYETSILSIVVFHKGLTLEDAQNLLTPIAENLAQDLFPRFFIMTATLDQAGMESLIGSPLISAIETIRQKQINF